MHLADFKNILVVVLVFVATYSAALFIFGQPFYIPEGSCFAVVLVFVVGHLGGFLAVQVGARSDLSPLLAINVFFVSVSDTSTLGHAGHGLSFRECAGQHSQRISVSALGGGARGERGLVYRSRLPNPSCRNSWSSQIKAFGLATILMRAGLKINYTQVCPSLSGYYNLSCSQGRKQKRMCLLFFEFILTHIPLPQAFRQAPWTVILLGAVPVFAEGFLDTIVFVYVYGMTFYFGAMAGFLLSAISPTVRLSYLAWISPPMLTWFCFAQVIVTGMLDLQKKNYGVQNNIPSIEMAAAGVDVVSGIAMYSIFQSLAIEQVSGAA